MSFAVNEEFKQNYAEVLLLVLADVALEQTFEQSIENQQVKKREAETAIEQQVIDAFEGEIAVIESNYNTAVSAISADTSKEVNLISQKAISSGYSQTLNALKTGYKEFKYSLGFEAEDFVQYHYYEKIRSDNSTNLKIVVSPDYALSFSTAY